MTTTPRLFVFAGIVSCLFACKRGFELPEEGARPNKEYAGPAESAFLELSFDSTGSRFELLKRSDPRSSASTFTLSGNYEQLNSGFSALTITSNRPSSVTAETIIAVEFSNDSFILLPFETNANELIALVEKDECPQNDLSGNAIYFDRQSGANNDSTPFLTHFLYSVNGNDIALSNNIALNDDFSQPNSTTIDSESCANGIAENGDNHHFLSSRSSVIQIDSNTRLFNIPARNLSALNTLNGDYVGFVRKYSQTEDTFIATASCTDGSCQVFMESSHESPTSSTLSYTITLDENSLNTPQNGYVTGNVNDTNTLTEATNIACIANADLNGSSSDTVRALACSAQAPDDATRDRVVNFMLVSSS